MKGEFFTEDGYLVKMPAIELSDTLDESIQKVTENFKNVKLVVQSYSWAILSLTVEVKLKKDKKKVLNGRLVISE